MTDDDIKRDRAIIARAIDGPWTVRVRQEERAVERTVMDANGHWVAEVGDDAGSADFIAEARTRWEAALDDNERLERRVAEFTFEASAHAAPIPMLLWCPKCGERHVDEGEFATRVHTTHACQACGLVWKPAKIPTVGVRFLPGYKNEPAEASEMLVEARAAATGDRNWCGVLECVASHGVHIDDLAASQGWLFRKGYGWRCPAHAAEYGTKLIDDALTRKAGG